MKSASLLALSYTLSLAVASPYPELQWDPATISTCVDWFDNGGSDTCEYVRHLFKISPEDFHAWNPSVGLDCKPWDYQSYCVLTREKLASLTSTTTTAPATTTTTKTTSSTHAPSPTAWNALGCYTDDDATFPVLETQVRSADSSLTIEKCEDACWKASNDTVLYAGVKQGNQCWCGSFVGGQTSRNQTDCNVPCAGNKAVVCGGKDRIGVFEPVTTTAEPPAACTTNAMGLAFPRPTGADCNVLAYSGDGNTIATYSSGDNVLSLKACASVCLSTTECTNLYYTEGKHCNLHAGDDTHSPNITSPYIYYDASCFVCPAVCTLVSPKPSGVACGVLAYSNGGTSLSTYSSGESVKSAADCAELCSATTGCTKFYFTAGQHCNLKSGTETHKPDTSAPYEFYDAGCFRCPTTSAGTSTVSSEGSNDQTSASQKLTPAFFGLQFV
ncbi:hypothetical protein F4678DRAFT_444455 [Xylaria arbuscula]|nr:hypothetical protein F4678DRAFT_444455 [Xylaria arbuscula]